jgi:predicted nucleic acid-binding protein
MTIIRNIAKRVQKITFNIKRRLNMRALLDTNIIIHRENDRVSNYSIGHLFRWLDKLNYDKVIHPLSVSEINKYKDPDTLKVINVKLQSYELIKTILEPNMLFRKSINDLEFSENDRIDNYLLFEVYSNRVDILITEDQKILIKARKINLQDKVLSINGFIDKVTKDNPGLIEYKMLRVRKTLFGEIDVKNVFFDSFRNDYPKFDEWFSRKCDEEAYICYDDTGDILGFLYLKTEGNTENYYDINPPFEPKKRLKIGTFKVESTGFRLGERFIKIIFDNALQRNVEEIYVTLFTNREELSTLRNQLLRWGFIDYGKKNEKEAVLVKKMHEYNYKLSTQENFPNILYDKAKYILPIKPEYHTRLLPDSKLNSENTVDFLGKDAQLYALLKIYITWARCDFVEPNDLVVFYRMGEEGGNKKYKSVLTTVVVVKEIIRNIPSEKDLIRHCQNRSVYSIEELKQLWRQNLGNLSVMKFIFVKSLTKRLTLKYLWDEGIVQEPSGPRPFFPLSNEQYDFILKDSETIIRYVDR